MIKISRSGKNIKLNSGSKLLKALFNFTKEPTYENVIKFISVDRAVRVLSELNIGSASQFHKFQHHVYQSLLFSLIFRQMNAVLTLKPSFEGQFNIFFPPQSRSSKYSFP